MTNTIKQMEPVQLIQQQLDAYNSKNITAWLSCYHPDAVQLDFHGAVLARGHDEMQQRISLRFSEPDLHAKLLNRMVMGDWVIDHEMIQRNFPQGRGQVEMLWYTQVTSRCEFQSRGALAMQGSLAKQCRLPCETG